MRLLAFLLLFIIGCSSKWVRVESGYMSTDAIPSFVSRVGGESIEATRLGTSVEAEAASNDTLAVDVGMGIATTLPIDGKETFYELDALLRLRWKLLEWVEPFVSIGVGFGWTPERWEPQGSSWGFPLFGGIGTRFLIRENEWFWLDYRYWHESNGSKIFGHSELPNPGFDAGGVFVGYSFAF